MKQFIKYIALIVCACSCWSCIDDEIGQEIDYSKPATVKLSIDFSDMQVVTPGTRSAGDAIGKMTDVCVLFYNADGTLAKDDKGPIYHYAEVGSTGYSVNIEKTVPAGTYKVVAVANMGELVKSETYKGTIERLTDLKSISLQWNNDTIAANNQMFGFFSLSSENEIDAAISGKGMNNVAPTEFDAPELVLSGAKTLYAKLYRTVAKVTVAFDGSELNSNVFVTITSIRLGNLPSKCSLWVENKATEEKNDTVNAGKKGAQSEILTDANFGLLRVTNRGTGESLFPKDAHSQEGPSLFMFENRQGLDTKFSYENDKDKTKARMTYGAFIEIEAQYANETTGSSSNGKIIYRYMLGEDTPGSYNNYNLTRNRHYKVTLMLQKSGKEKPYWRVEYTENPSISLPTEVNISYRNSAKLEIPFTVADEGVASVTAKIIKNPWYDEDANGNHEAKTDGGALMGLDYGFLAWDGNPSSNSFYGSNKKKSVDVTPVEGKYNLSVQTEPLGFWTDKGDKPLDSFTGYNNYSNPRTAIIRVTVNYNSGKPKTADVKVVQVPRIVNPIAVYRKWNSDKEFKVRLLNALGAEIESYGPWKAEVESGKDWIRIKSEKATTYGTSFDSDGAGGAIRFDYKPLSTLSSENATPRCGVIVVRFSNYNVEHRIYVRQGDAPMAIGGSESLWTSSNYIGVDAGGVSQFAKSPMEEGAWLKSGNSLGILADNLNNKDKFESSLEFFTMSDGTPKSWGEFSSSGAAQFNAPGYELPTEDDLNNLTSLSESSGFGIGYDDNATQTVDFNEDAQYTNPAMGRRGIVICDKDGRNLFFPIGKRGYGRRRYDIKSGGLHYAIATIEEDPAYRPALFGLPRSMGAIYLVNGVVDKSSYYHRLSFNYSLSNIESQTTENIDMKDACFARLIKVYDETFKRKFLIRINAKPEVNAQSPSIEPYGDDKGKITNCKIVPDGYHKVSFKYNLGIDKDNNGVIIKEVKDGKTYKAKFTIQEIEEKEEQSRILLLLENTP